ncbi:hypothetical protein [Levilinea saccharolytica]|uniref:Uncharacterized protein n=1 Tax=Levilinea saccharolytica TaxID=229921 RepID=A0A0M8JPQ8_9CHLR|nr:hypothetical protein [Levilinea saccharolytica]GAP19341.1 hypothetical protein LSAC_03243 [Levilinea saccharolytica]
MVSGTPVDRQWVVVLKHGQVVIDWGDGCFQAVDDGLFVAVDPHEISHTISEAEIGQLLTLGWVNAYDGRYLYVPNLPDRPQPPDQD